MRKSLRRLALSSRKGPVNTGTVGDPGTVGEDQGPPGGESSGLGTDIGGVVNLLHGHPPDLRFWKGWTGPAGRHEREATTPIATAEERMAAHNAHMRAMKQQREWRIPGHASAVLQHAHFDPHEANQLIRETRAGNVTFGPGGYHTKAQETEGLGPRPQKMSWMSDADWASQGPEQTARWGTEQARRVDPTSEGYWTPLSHNPNAGRAAQMAPRVQTALQRLAARSGGRRG